MATKIEQSNKATNETIRVVLVDEGAKLPELGYSKSDATFLKDQFKQKLNPVLLSTGANKEFVFQISGSADNAADLEKWRRLGTAAQDVALKLKVKSVGIIDQTTAKKAGIMVLEGFLLSNYAFNKYKTKEPVKYIEKVVVDKSSFDTKQVKELEIVVEATCKARDLVNEPVSYLTAEKLAKEITSMGKSAGFSTEVFNKSKITSLKMGGLLAVNQGSTEPPTFSILSYKPAKAVNKEPVILVGKGVVYDTGGLSLKPTPNSMDLMKSDMGGAAAVAGTLYAVAKAKLPLYVIGLVPSTDNRPGLNAYAPGDVIKMHSGHTVEVLNTDAEGRMILADALSYAKKYKPQLVIDLATLTGAAVRAIGTQGVVYMGNASDEVKRSISASSYEVFERLVEFPMWEEYDDQMKSDIADIKNIGGPYAGATTAGMFLKNFTDYPWLHLDIAGMAFLDGKDGYRLKNGTGVGVRLLFNFLKKMI